MVQEGSSVVTQCVDNQTKTKQKQGEEPNDHLEFIPQADYTRTNRDILAEQPGRHFKIR